MKANIAQLKYGKVISFDSFLLTLNRIKYFKHRFFD